MVTDRFPARAPGLLGCVPCTCPAQQQQHQARAMLEAVRGQLWHEVDSINSNRTHDPRGHKVISASSQPSSAFFSRVEYTGSK